MAACHLPCRRPLAWLMHLQRHPVFRFAPCSLDAFADAIGVLATRFRTIFRRLLSSGHRLCLSGWVVVAALVGSPCWIVVAYLNWESCVLSRPLAALARATVTLGSNASCLERRWTETPWDVKFGSWPFLSANNLLARLETTRCAALGILSWQHFERPRLIKRLIIKAYLLMLRFLLFVGWVWLIMRG